MKSKKLIFNSKLSERNAQFYEAEADKLDGWADDLKVALEREIKELDRQIKEARRAANTRTSLLKKNLLLKNKLKRLKCNVIKNEDHYSTLKMKWINNAKN